MNQDNQYHEDRTRLASLIERYTTIPQERTYQFILDNSAKNILPYSHMLCESEAQRSKLITLFEFKSLYETIRGAEDNHKYTMNSTEKAGEYLKNCFADSPDKEKFVAVFLDAKYGVLATKNMSVGTATHANIYVRELAKEALFHNAISVIISHNHLSGVMAPSREDKAATEKIKATLGAVGVELADHIIVAEMTIIHLQIWG